ncbi:hypothetical protein [Rhizobium sp. BK251]|uniref:hypothetical protein n=1 Tax=Rhizobium sp. BK251 TaxID=2512125 RepID=UPI001050AFFE|nr:hypothetical protein [Rhizobium sp. BK251]TCL70519.1 hypothetical protein EV286_107394 [Rhizobium sp. BK251]
MTRTTDFVAELIRAANEIERLMPLERRRLLDRSVSTILALRDYLEASGKVVPFERGVSKDLQQVSAMLHEVPEVIVAHALLEAADEIRRLRILAHDDKG